MVAGPITMLEEEVAEARSYLEACDREIAAIERTLEAQQANREKAASHLERHEVALHAVKAALGDTPEPGLQGDGEKLASKGDEPFTPEEIERLHNDPDFRPDFRPVNAYPQWSEMIDRQRAEVERAVLAQVPARKGALMRSIERIPGWADQPMDTRPRGSDRPLYDSSDL